MPMPSMNKMMRQDQIRESMLEKVLRILEMRVTTIVYRYTVLVHHENVEWR